METRSVANNETSEIARSGDYIAFAAKFLEKESHATDFLDGKLYANKLGYFKRLEERHEANRGDIHEGTIAWGQPGQIRVEINGLDMSEDLAEPVSLSSHRLDELNVLCLYTGRIKNETDAAKIRRQLLIHEKCREFGDHLVLLTNGPEFLRRVMRGAELRNIRAAHGPVRYYNPGKFSGSFPGIRGAFMKQEAFGFQQEYRIVFEPRIAIPGPLRLDIGDISDIAIRSTIEEINRDLEVRAGPGTQ